MDKYVPVLINTEFFSGLSEQEIRSILVCLGTHERSFKRGTIIQMAEEDIHSVGLIINGSVNISKDDFNGNQMIISHVSIGDMFGEAIVCAGIKKSPVTVTSVTDCTVLFFELKKIITTCSSSCTFHNMLIENMMKILATKNILLNDKMDIISKKSIREKLLAYFSQRMLKEHKNSFSIPFSREELADFICVNRSAMSRELSRMKDEGIIAYKRNKFRVYTEKL